MFDPSLTATRVIGGWQVYDERGTVCGFIPSRGLAYAITGSPYEGVYLGQRKAKRQ